MEADDFNKPAAAATKVNEGGAVAASSVSTTADESSMLKAVMLSQAQITQGLLARAQATQELLETLKPSLKRRSSLGKKDVAFLDTDSSFTLAQQARVGDDAHDAAPLSSLCHMSKEEYIRMTTKCILAGLFGMTPRKLEPILHEANSYVRKSGKRKNGTTTNQLPSGGRATAVSYVQKNWKVESGSAGGGAVMMR